MKSKKGEIGETITWVVATIIIIVILTISLLIVNNMFRIRLTTESTMNTDVIASKSFYSYVLTPVEQATVFDKIKTQKDLDNVTGQIAVSVIKNLYDNEYGKVWVGVFPGAGTNTYFGNSGSGAGSGEEVSTWNTYSEIKFEAGKPDSVNLFLDK